MFIVFKEYKNTLIVQVLTWVDIDVGAVYLRVIANKNPADRLLLRPLLYARGQQPSASRKTY